MPTVRVNDILKDKILISRESARLLKDALGEMLESAKTDETAPDATPAVVDFDGVEGMAPSFLDELLLILDSIVGAQGGAGERRLIVANPPTRLSLKFEAVARGHRMSVRALPEGGWLITDAGNTSE